MKLGKKKLQELKEKKISIEALDDRYFINSQDKIEVENFLKLLTNDICSFQEIVDKFKSIYEFGSLLENNKLFEKLIDDNLLTQNDLRYLLNRIGNATEAWNLSKNTILLRCIVENDLFQELVDKYKDFGGLSSLLDNKKFFEELIENNKLNKEDLRYLLNRLDDIFKLRSLCWNTQLTKYILNEFMLNRELVDKFNRMIENSWYEKENIYTIFELIEERKSNKEILELSELNKKVYLLNSFELNLDQKLELSEVLRNNEIAQNTLIQIIDNNLQDQYDFENLKRILIKDTEKKKIKFNL